MSHFKNNNGDKNRFVQSDSVTSQFHLLETERDEFLKATNDANAKYKAAQAKIVQLKKEQARLLGQFRVDQEEFGVLTRKRDMLTKEATRLNRVIELEGKALQACAKHSQSLKEAEEKAISQYVKEMWEATDQAESLLERESRARLLLLLTGGSIEAVVPKLSNLPDKDRKSIENGIMMLKNANECYDQKIAQFRQLKDRLEKTRPCSEDHSQENMELFYGTMGTTEKDSIV